MKLDSRLSSILHVLLHIAAKDAPVPSELLSRYLGTNPVVVRRTMGGLRDAGLVRSGRGKGGGWTLGRPLSDITLRDVYVALGEPSLFAFGNRNETPDCLVEQAVNARVDEAMRDAERLLLDRFATITLADLDADFRKRLARHPGRIHDHAPS